MKKTVVSLLLIVMLCCLPLAAVSAEDGVTPQEVAERIISGDMDAISLMEDLSYEEQDQVDVIVDRYIATLTPERLDEFVQEVENSDYGMSLKQTYGEDFDLRSFTHRANDIVGSYSGREVVTMVEDYFNSLSAEQLQQLKSSYYREDGTIDSEVVLAMYQAAKDYHENGGAVLNQTNANQTNANQTNANQNTQQNPQPTKSNSNNGANIPNTGVNGAGVAVIAAISTLALLCTRKIRK